MPLQTANSYISSLLVTTPSPLLKAGFENILNFEDYISTCHFANSYQAMMEHLANQSTDLLILDETIFTSFLSSLQSLRAIQPQCKIILLSHFLNDQFIIEAFRSGIKGFLHKHSSAEEIKLAIRKVYQDKIYYCPQVSQRISHLFGLLNLTSNQCYRETIFTSKELEIIRLISKEYCTKEIACLLHTNSRAIDIARQNLLKKIGCKTVVGLIIYALKAGIIGIE